MAGSFNVGEQPSMPRKANAMAPRKANGAKPSLGHPDALAAAQEACRHAQDGNVKLSRAVDTMRVALETIVVAEIDNTTGLPVSAADLRGLALKALETYSRLTGQSWRSTKSSRAGQGIKT